MQLLEDPRRRRWFLWGLLAVSYLLVNIYRLSTAVISEQLMAAFSASGAQLGTLHAMFFIVYAVMQIPTGVLVDRVGPRRTAATGAIVMNIGAIWFAFAGGYGAALIARFLIGLGGSVIFVSMLRFCASWYDAAGFATMNGLSFAVGGIGGILATTPFAIAVDATGWEQTIIGLGVIGIGVAAASAYWVRDSPPTDKLGRIETESTDKTLEIAEIAEAMRRILGDYWVWVVSIILFAGGGVNLTLFGLWGIPYVVQMHDTSVEFASVFTLLGGAGAVLGPPTIGWLAGRTGRRTSLVIGGSLLYTACLGTLTVLPAAPLWVVGIAFFVIGFLLGAFVLTYPIIRERHPDRVSGIALGAINGASFVGASVLPTLLGVILDTYWTGETLRGARVYSTFGYRLAFATMTMLAVVTIVCAVWLHHRTRDRQIQPA